MADAGYRSIEVFLINNTQASLNISAAAITGIDTKWIDGEEAVVGHVIGQFEGQLWGVSTDNPAATTGATVNLSGLGSPQVSIDFRNDQFGTSTVNATGNNKIKTKVTKIPTSSDAHTVFQVELSPNQLAIPTHAVALRGMGSFGSGSSNK